MNGIRTNEWIARSYWHITQVDSREVIKDENGEITIRFKPCDWCKKNKK